MIFKDIKIPKADKDYYFSRLRDIYAEMQKRYSIVADALNFTCEGCNDNCCYTHFKHHTVIEYLYLMEGLYTLDESARAEVVDKARKISEYTAEAEDSGENIRILCPVNKDGFCLLYGYRLMICRLHGTAHYFDTPKGRVEGPGCYRFEELSAEMKSVPMLDRTDIYRDLAYLEMELRKNTDINVKFKYSIAEMIAASF
ncbi:MAG: hypothetical protein ACQEQS_00635 [Thermodesulfobacteriota bacterium]